MNIQEDIDDIIQENGDLASVRSVAPEIVAQFAGKLPILLTTFWSQRGIGTWANGLFTLCLPTDFQGLLSQVFSADRDFSHRDCHIIGYSAFGQLLVWSERHWVTQIDLVTGRVSCPVLIDPTKAKNADIHMSTSLSVKKGALDCFDDDGKPLFARAVRKLGRPGPGQAFGFVPALAMGGAPSLDNIRIVPALEHFLFLAQLQQFSLVDYLSRPPRVVRMIG
jgi:hypothetical protein